jgi:uncharacterized RDD family membrane protein YckC
MRWLNQIALVTPESVELEFMLAGIGNRAYAFTIDFVIWLLTISLFLSVWSTAYDRIEELVLWLGGDADAARQWVFAIGLLIVFSIYVSYFIVFETLWRGQTPGKRIANIRVICDDGRPAGLFQATSRALLRPIDDLLFTGSIGFFLIWLTKREKRLGDWLAGTLVIQADRPSAPKDFVIADTAQSAARQLEAIAQLELLPPTYFAQLRYYLYRRSQFDRRPKTEVSLYLARRIKRAIKLETLPMDMTPDLFLEAVYLAYQGTRSEAQVAR